RMESGARSFMVGLDRGFGSSGCSRRRAASRGRAAFSSLTAANGARIPEALRNRDAQCGFDGGRDVAPKTKPTGLPAETKFPGDPGASRRRELPMSKKNRTDGVDAVRPEVQRSRWRFVRWLEVLLGLVLAPLVVGYALRRITGNDGLAHVID